MRKDKDPRITAKNISLKNGLMMFGILLVVCGTFFCIYWRFPHDYADKFYIYLSMMAYVVVISISMMILIGIYRGQVLMRPVYRLGEAARKVAEGDFSVRVASERKDGKKDEFDVLFDDFNIMVEQLASTELLKNDFVSNVSHELKTPLSIISNYATILQDKNLSEEEREQYLSRITEASRRISTLVTNILQLSRIEHQKILVHKKTYNLSEQICKCALGFDQIFDEKNIELEIEMDQNIVITSDEELLDIVWNNMISNALKFTEPGGKISLHLIEEGNQIIAEIADNGCGMDEKNIKHIFDKFYQIDASHATQGNGIGLAMVKQIADLLGMAIQVESRLGEGTLFRIIFTKKDFGYHT